MAGICGWCTYAIQGHPNVRITNFTAKCLDLSKFEHDEKCECCIRGKQRKKNVTKKVEFRAEKSGDYVYFNISSIQHKSLGGSKFWLLFVYIHIRYKKSYFLNLISQMVNKGFKYIHFMETHNMDIAIFRCNNVGENIKYKEKLVT